MNALIVDIGSNSIRAMKVEHAAGGLTFFDKRVFTTRLADGLLRTGCIQIARIEQSLEVLRMLKEGAGCEVFAYATSAVRDAANRQDFLDAAEAIIGRPVDVLSGEEEARLAFKGAAQDNGALVDIGGGSTQLISADFAQSFPLGCVRAKDACTDTRDFDALYASLTPLMNATFHFHHVIQDQWTGVGGTVTTLAAIHFRLTSYDRKRIQGCTMTIADVLDTLRSIDALHDQRPLHPLLKERHDVILPGGAILLYLMQTFGIPVLRISDADGMEGYAIEVLLK